MHEIKILIVDDDPDISDLLVSTLQDEFDITTADCGKAA